MFAVHPLYDPNPTADAIDEADVLARVGGDGSLLAEIVDVFLEDADTLVSDLRRAVCDRNPDGVAGTAHRLNGALATLSAIHAARAARGLEMVGRIGDLSSAPAGFASLEAEIDRLLPALQALRTRLRRQPCGRLVADPDDLHGGSCRVAS